MLATPTKRESLPESFPEIKSAPNRNPLSMTQNKVARRMPQSARDISQFSESIELNADELSVYRSWINAQIDDLPLGGWQNAQGNWCLHNAAGVGTRKMRSIRFTKFGE